jgi:hypothetical protein
VNEIYNIKTRREKIALGTSYKKNNSFVLDPAWTRPLTFEAVPQTLYLLWISNALYDRRANQDVTLV